MVYVARSVVNVYPIPGNVSQTAVYAYGTMVDTDRWVSNGLSICKRLYSHSSGSEHSGFIVTTQPPAEY
ncbi:hypothetical protein DMA11_16485 [Marinilabiliaceae bacterium JC017]|nr:hypothetical protein DMA11_16485 [Marinilabiliaceae bacterium JC017]